MTKLVCTYSWQYHFRVPTIESLHGHHTERRHREMPPTAAFWALGHPHVAENGIPSQLWIVEWCKDNLHSYVHRERSKTHRNVYRRDCHLIHRSLDGACTAPCWCSWWFSPQISTCFLVVCQLESHSSSPGGCHHQFITRRSRGGRDRCGTLLFLTVRHDYMYKAKKLFSFFWVSQYSFYRAYGSLSEIVINL